MTLLRKGVWVLFAAAGVSGVAYASGSPYDAITAAVDWTAVSTGIGAVAALLAGVLVVKKGARMLLSMIGR